MTRDPSLRASSLNQSGRQEANVLSGHTPTPWRVDPRRSLRVFAGDDDTVASVGCQASLSDQWHANAAFIVRAVNSHDALVGLVEEAAALQALNYGDATALHLAMIVWTNKARSTLTAARVQP